MIYLDGKQFTDRATSYHYLIKQLGLPDYTGYNLDALWEVLNDKQSLKIEIYQPQTIVSNLGDYGWRLLKLFEDLNDSDQYLVKVRW